MLRPYIHPSTPGLRPGSVTSLLLLPGEHRAPRPIQRYHGEVVRVEHTQRERLAGHAPHVGHEGERRARDEWLAGIHRAHQEFGRRAGALDARAEDPRALLVAPPPTLPLHRRMVQPLGPLEPQA